MLQNRPEHELNAFGEPLRLARRLHVVLVIIVAFAYVCGAAAADAPAPSAPAAADAGAGQAAPTVDNGAPGGVKSAEDIAREKAIAEFTQKMKDANYPALFEKAAAEFNVPADVLKGISFAETRWEQLQWPPGETASPENGMPRPYGIMSLWDNDYLGHSLLDAAKLIGKDPEELKSDAYQNMRGAAALLRKLYDETPKPADAQGDEIESWRKAIVKYSGIPQPELSESHALEVYEWMNKGFHEYGIEWPEHPVKLDAMREEVGKIKAEARARLQAKMQEEEAKGIAPAGVDRTRFHGGPGTEPVTSASRTAAKAGVVVAAAAPATHAEGNQRWLLLGLIILLLVIAGVYLFKRKPDSPAKR
jgi:hypothetical protein